jgi:hypothetical protein
MPVAAARDVKPKRKEKKKILLVFPEASKADMKNRDKKTRGPRGEKGRDISTGPNNITRCSSRSAIRSSLQEGEYSLCNRQVRLTGIHGPRKLHTYVVQDEHTRVAHSL